MLYDPIKQKKSTKLRVVKSRSGGSVGGGLRKRIMPYKHRVGLSVDAKKARRVCLWSRRLGV